MDIQKIQNEVFGEENKENFFTSLKEIKNSVISPAKNRNLFLDLLDSPAILPLFNPISNEDMDELIKNSDITQIDSFGNNALLASIDKNIGAIHIEKILSKSNLSHKNNEGLNVLTLAVINQNLLPTNLLYDIYNSRSETFGKTCKGLSPSFYENRNLNTETLNNKYMSLKRVLKKYEETLKEKNKTHTSIFETNNCHKP